MVARTAERVMPPLTQTASEALWGRTFSAADASTSGRGQATSPSRLDDDDVVVLLSDETAASEAAPLVSHNAVKLAFCGGVSGAFAKTCTAPLARLTILYQVKGLAMAGPGAGAQQLGVFAALRHIAATEGITALWKGNLITIMHRIPYSATNFFTYESTKRALQGRLSNESARAWAAGATSGLVACTAAYPLDLLRTRIAAETGPRCSAAASTSTSTSTGLGSVSGAHHFSRQHQSYRRVPSALRRILAEQGVRGLYKGLGATLVQVVPGLAFNFCFYDTFKRLAAQNQQVLSQLQLQRPAQPLGQGQADGQQSLPLSHHHHHGQWQQREQAEAGGSWSSRAGGVAGARGATVSCAAAAAAGPAVSPSASASPSPLTSAVCACLSGLCTSSLTFPLDVVRRRLQVYERGALGRMRYLDVVRAVYSEGGLAAFYRGLGPEFMKVLPGMAIAFTTYESLKSLTGAAP